MRRSRLYTLFERDGRKWRHLGGPALPRDAAVRFYQTALLASALGHGHGLERRLRPLARPQDATTGVDRGQGAAPPAKVAQRAANAAGEAGPR
jgi:hypothetical protein